MASAHIAALLILQECASDVDGDGLINVNDLLGMLSQFGADGAIPEDVNGDNIVNVRRPQLLLGLCVLGRPSLICLGHRDALAPRRLTTCSNCCQTLGGIWPGAVETGWLAPLTERKQSIAAAAVPLVDSCTVQPSVLGRKAAFSLGACPTEWTLKPIATPNQLSRLHFGVRTPLLKCAV